MLLVVWLKFILDGMLGKLSRWLRILGHDVKYSISIEDSDLIELAKMEKRVLVTRDLDLFKKGVKEGIEIVLIKAESLTGKLGELCKKYNFDLEVNISNSRCPKCNNKIRSVSRVSVFKELPEMTAKNFNEFWKCVGCDQIFWAGSHWKKIIKTLEDTRRLFNL